MEASALGGRGDAQLTGGDDVHRRTRLNRLAAVSAVVVTGGLVGASVGQAAESEKVFGLVAGAPQTLITFQSDSPGTIASTTSITGLVGGGESVVGLDTQPSTGRLFAVTKDAADNGRVYSVDKSTAVATVLTSTPFALGAATSYGVDFNPVANAIRIVSGDELSLRVSPVSGNLAGADATLTNPDVATASDNNVVSVAYTNAVNGAQQTTLYGLDTTSDKLVRQGGLGGFPSPNGGVLTNIGPLAFNILDPAGFDISGASNTAHVAVQLIGFGGSSFFSTINLSTGAIATGLEIGTTVDVQDIAVDTQPPSVQFSAATTSVSEKAGKATVTITRTGNTAGTSTVSYATAVTATSCAGAACTATAGTDYTAIPATAVTFAAGETAKTFDISIDDDTTVEDAETIGVALSANTAAGLGAPNVAQVTVLDNDPATVNVPVPGPTVTGPTVTGPTVTVAPTPVAIKSATAKVAAARDKRAPYAFKVSGSITPPDGLDPTAACRYGTVRMTLKPANGGKATVYERLVTTKCTFSATLVVAKKGKSTVAVKFLGSDRLTSRSITTLKVRAG
jgi:hypothetical protein